MADDDPSSGVRGFYSQPALRGDELVFSSESDLWTAGLAADGADADPGGQLASRLTRSAGHSTNAAFSPNGKWVAFTSDRAGGGDDVWIMPARGGRSIRLTYESVPTPYKRWHGLAVQGWSSDGKSVLYCTPHFSKLPDPQLVLVSAFGPMRGECTVLQLAQASEGVLVRLAGASADSLFFVRLPFQGSLSRSYKGGFIQQLWRWQLGDAPTEAVPLTADYPGISRSPMWDPYAQRLYFLSDRSGVMK